MHVQANSPVLLTLAAAVGGLVFPSPGRAQPVFDWPFRAAVGPEALLTGAAATLWNPAGASGAPPGAWLVSVDGPEATQVGGVAVAATQDLPWLGTLGVGFSHLGIDDIPRTVDSPAPEPGDVEVAEDAVGLALSRPIGPWAAVGLGGRWVRARVGGDDRSRATVSLGLRLAPDVKLQPALALAVLGFGGDERVLGALSASLPPSWTGPFQVGVGYGFDSSTGPETLDQRLSLRLSWLQRLHAGVGLTFTDDGSDGVTPLWTLGADVGRYSLAVLREELSNDFGAAHYYRAAIRF